MAQSSCEANCGSASPLKNRTASISPDSPSARAYGKALPGVAAARFLRMSLLCAPSGDTNNTRVRPALQAPAGNRSMLHDCFQPGEKGLHAGR